MKKFKFTIRGNEYDVEMQDFEENLATIEVNGTQYKVELHKEVKKSKTPTLVRPVVHSTEPKNIEKKPPTSFKVTAPLPGNIIQVFVKEGDHVKKGDKLLTYEAMKMENVVESEKEGTIKSLKVNPGDSVLQGDILIEIDE